MEHLPQLLSCAVSFPRLFATYDSHLLTRRNAVHAGQIARMEQREAAHVEKEWSICHSCSLLLSISQGYLQNTTHTW